VTALDPVRRPCEFVFGAVVPADRADEAIARLRTVDW
jgi:hypothetical protein